MRAPNQYQEEGCDGVKVQSHSMRLWAVTSSHLSINFFFLFHCLYIFRFQLCLILCSFYPASSVQCTCDELEPDSYILIPSSLRVATSSSKQPSSSWLVVLTSGRQQSPLSRAGVNRQTRVTPHPPPQGRNVAAATL